MSATEMSYYRWKDQIIKSKRLKDYADKLNLMLRLLNELVKTWSC